MKFMAVIEGNWSDMPVMIENYRRRIETGEFIKNLFGPVQIIGEPKIITFFEMDDPDEIIKMVIDYAPEAIVKIYPIEDTTRFLEIWEERMK